MKPAHPDLRTADDPEVELCTEGGVDHDWRPYKHLAWGKPRTSFRCVWCHAVACGDWGEHDPCLRPYHHRDPHRSRTGITWPLGGNRP